VRRSLRFDAAVERELGEAIDFYDLESPGLGGVLLDEVERALARIEAFPEAAEPVREGIRKHLLHKFPCALFYSLRPDQIRILAVAHAKRRPFYWADRR
jgi:toxin ParE1/3/4